MNARSMLRTFALLCLLAVLAACGGDGSDDTAAAARVDLRVLAGSELRELEPQLTAAARKAGVSVGFAYAGTLDMVDRVNNGERFDAILPPNGAYPLLALSTKPVAREKLWYSRIALGVKAAKARALGWDGKPPTWADVAREARAGNFRYAMTNPTSSNTGMSALFAVAAAAAHKTEDLTVADIDANVLKDFLSGQAITAGSSGWLADTFVREAASVDGIVNYEAVLLRLNPTLPPGDRLVLVYPTDGVITADYPLLLLDAAKRAPWQRWVDVLKSAEFQNTTLSAAFLRPSNPDVQPAAALPRDAVAELAFPNRLEVIDEVLLAYQGEWRRPATSIFVLDVSGSMAGDRLEAMRAALKVLSGADASTASSRLLRFQTRERVALISFSSRVSAAKKVEFERSSFEAASRTVREYADALEVRGGTAIYSALAQAEELAAGEQRIDPQRNVSIVLLTDGQNNEGITAEEFRRRYGGARVRIFPILFGEADADELRDLAERSGGRTFDARKAALAAVFKEIRGYQ